MPEHVGDAPAGGRLRRHVPQRSEPRAAMRTARSTPSACDAALNVHGLGPRIDSPKVARVLCDVDAQTTSCRDQQEDPEPR